MTHRTMSERSYHGATSQCKTVIWTDIMELVLQSRKRTQCHAGLDIQTYRHTDVAPW